MNMTIQFDTLRYVERLKAAGMPDAQAKAGAEALSAALGEATSGLLATKEDINSIKIDVAVTKSDLKLEIADLRSEQKLHRWILFTIVAGIVSLVVKAFFMA